MMYVDVSVIIINYNGKDYLCRCLESVFKNNYKNYEVIVVDNGSTDGSLNYVKKRFIKNSEKLRLIGLEKNYGPSKARNEGVKLSRGKYLAFLDNDTQVDKNWIIEAIKLFESDKKIGCLQCKLLLLKEKNRFDYAGEYLTPSGFLAQRAKYREIDDGQYDQPAEILAAKSAGMFIRKDVFEKIGGFDEDYFIYVEETDLCWRSWLIGYKTVFCSHSVVYHEFGTSIKILSKNRGSFNVRFHGTKNYIMTLIKDLGTKQLISTLPRHIFVWFGFAFFMIAKGDFRSGINTLRGINWNFTNLQATLFKRKEIQSKRIVSDKILFKTIMKKQSIFKKAWQVFLSRKVIKLKIVENLNINENSFN